MAKSDKSKAYLLVAYYLIFTALFLLLALITPRYNWDIIGYIAAVKSFDIDDKGELHAFVYTELEEEIPQEAYAILVNTPYREAVSEDPEILHHERLLYQIRLAYVGLIYLFHKAGASIVFATHLVSALAVFIGLWLIFLAIWERVDDYLLLTLPLFVLTLGLFEVARLSTADGLAFLFGAFIFFLLLKEHGIVLLVLPLTVLVRTDQIIFVLLLLAYLFISRKQWRIWCVAAAILAILLYITVNHLFGYPDAAVLSRILAGKTINSVETNSTVAMVDYWRVLARSSMAILQYKSFLTYVIILVLSVILYVRLPDQFVANLRFPLALSLVASLSVLLHYLAFPHMWSRFFSMQYLLGAAILLMMMTAALNASSHFQKVI